MARRTSGERERERESLGRVVRCSLVNMAWPAGCMCVYITPRTARASRNKKQARGRARIYRSMHGSSCLTNCALKCIMSAAKWRNMKVMRAIILGVQSFTDVLQNFQVTNLALYQPYTLPSHQATTNHATSATQNPYAVFCLIARVRVFVDPTGRRPCDEPSSCIFVTCCLARTRSAFLGSGLGE